MGGAERNARKKKQQQMAAKSVAAARGSSGSGDRNKIIIGVVVESLIFRVIENRTVRRWGMQR